MMKLLNKELLENTWGAFYNLVSTLTLLLVGMAAAVSAYRDDPTIFDAWREPVMIGSCLVGLLILLVLVDMAVERYFFRDSK